MWHERKWSLLSRSLKHLHDQIVHDWELLIDDPATDERSCLRFVRDHGALFFQRRTETPISISELSLGSDYKVDFVTATEGFSGGTTYKLIELESPNSKLYRSDGKTSARLSGAIDQILEWRRWISQHRTQARKLFPSTRWNSDAAPTFSYQIVIGRRSETAKVQDKIWSRIHEAGIEIVSFDRLTNFLRFPLFDDNYWAGLSTQGQEYLDDRNLLNRAACPFVKTISDSLWRKAASENHVESSSHLISPFLDYIAPNTNLNEERLNQFDQAVLEIDKANKA